MTRLHRWVFILGWIGCFFSASVQAAVHQSRDHLFRTVVLAEGLNYPWSMAFLPGGKFLVTERPGGLKVIDLFSKIESVMGLPKITAYGQGGLLDVILDPAFAENRRLYFTYTAPGQGGIGTEVVRAELRGNRLEKINVLFRMAPKVESHRHFGSRLLWLDDATVLVTLGDRGFRPLAQQLNNHMGAIVRLHPDGRVPSDNPFVNEMGAREEIFSYGHRNVQGITRDPRNGRIWAIEHGPQGGDELNLIKPKVNYGWPVITYGVNYVIGTRIGLGPKLKGMAQPAYQWTPSIAPSGLAIYLGERFPQWKGSLFVGALKFRLLSRLILDGQRIVDEEWLLEDTLGRIRDVRAGPDGFIYLLTDARNGKLIRLEPVL